MIALAPAPNSISPRCPRPSRPSSAHPDWPERFLLLLPLVRKIARHAFRKLSRDSREDAVQEVIANAYVASARLVERGKEDMAFATPLARFAVAQFRAGRRVGAQLTCMT